MPLKNNNEVDEPEPGEDEAREYEAQEEATKLCKSFFCYLNSFCLSDFIYFTVKEVTEKVEHIKVRVQLFIYNDLFQ